MPERRRKLLRNDWTLISAQRRDRPSDFDYRVSTAEGGDCPFDPGHEDRTPPEVDRIPAPKHEQITWRARAVPNKFPAVHRGSSPPESVPDDERTAPATGDHEVIVESPQHDLGLDAFSVDQMRTVLTLYERRISDHARQPDVSSVQVFRNAGAKAGGSLAHPHGQLVALPFVPSTVARRREYTLERFREHDECPICRMLRREHRSGERMIKQTERFSVLCPYAPDVPYETWVVPRDHQPRFAPLDDANRGALAGVLPSVVKRIKDVLEQPAFNLLVRDDLAGVGPGENPADAYHWFLRLVPRITDHGGFESSTGIPVVSVPPETAARDLRRTD